MNLSIFSNELFGDVRVIEIDEKIYFVGKDIAQALGYKDPSSAVSKHCKHIKKSTIEAPCQNGNVVKTQTSLIPEGDVYRLIVKSKLPSAEKFETWVFDEVLPQLRRTGVVITENATEEAIDFETKYGTRRIRKTFRESNDIEKDWEEFKELSKIERDAKRLTNKDRIKLCDIISDELENVIADNISDMKASKVLLYREIITDIKDEKQRLSNKMYGGLLSAKTKEIKELESNIRDLTFTTLDVHGFSNNYMYSTNSFGTVHRSAAYNRWIMNFPKEDVPNRVEYEIFEDIDFNMPLGIEIKYVCKDNTDIRNLDKSFIDMIFNRILCVDDNIVEEVKSSKVGSCDRYEDGRISFAIYNI